MAAATGRHSRYPYRRTLRVSRPVPNPTGVTEDAQTGSDVPAMEGITVKHDT